MIEKNEDNNEMTQRKSAIKNLDEENQQQLDKEIRLPMNHPSKEISIGNGSALQTKERTTESAYDRDSSVMAFDTMQRMSQKWENQLKQMNDMFNQKYEQLKQNSLVLFQET